jgi:thioredoxin-dependent peroxiredoxin
VSLLSPGDIAPDVEGRRPDGSPLRLSDLLGRYVLVYFYPKDETPGCTAEACSLNDSLQDLTDGGADVIGVSADSWDSHRRFQEKHGLRFALAADPDKKVAGAYGVGRMLGVLPVFRRVSFLVDPEGRIAEVWPSVRPSTHAAEVLEAVRRRSAASEAELEGRAQRAPVTPPR